MRGSTLSIGSPDRKNAIFGMEMVSVCIPTHICMHSQERVYLGLGVHSFQYYSNKCPKLSCCKGTFKVVLKSKMSLFKMASEDITEKRCQYQAKIRSYFFADSLTFSSLSLLLRRFIGSQVPHRKFQYSFSQTSNTSSKSFLPPLRFIGVVEQNNL